MKRNSNKPLSQQGAYVAPDVRVANCACGRAICGYSPVETKEPNTTVVIIDSGTGGFE